jgi:alpha-tubulin suppressor-like RCC1 family protein
VGIATALGTLLASRFAIAEPRVPGARSYGSIAEGDFHGCAVARDGTVLCGGDNEYGQLGDGTTTSRSIPVQVSGLTNQVYVAAGNLTSCSVAANGSVWCWGLNGSGQVGNGTTGGPIGPKPGYTWGYDTPQQVIGNGWLGTFALSSIVEVTVGDLFACARDAEGDVWCWGDNSYSQLGSATPVDPNTLENVSSTALFVPRVANAIQVSAGADHACALLADHTVTCWGYNGDGELGNGTINGSPAPATVPGLSNVKRIAASAWGTCALLSDGTVKCWGANFVGQMGNGTISQQGQLSPWFVYNSSGTDILRNVADLSRGGAWTTCGVLANGVGECWGYNAHGETGSGTASEAQALPAAVAATGGSPIADIAMGWTQACARTADGNYWCWGSNGYGQLGDGTTNASSSPVYNDIPKWLSPAQRISAGEGTGCAIVSAFGTVSCWGYNLFNDVGDGTNTDRPFPVPVAGLSSIVGLARGDFTTCALRGDGLEWCWGINNLGQVGDGTTTTRPTPAAVTGLENVIAIGSTCALVASGDVFCWGANGWGQIGDGTNTNEPVPTQVSGLAEVVAIDDGLEYLGMDGGEGSHCAIRSDASVWCWGANDFGQLGNGTTAESLVPAEVTGLTGAVAISSGFASRCALKSDGTIWCWGTNTAGLAGPGSTTASFVPVQVTGIYGAVALSMGFVSANPPQDAACAVLAWGTVECWGTTGGASVGSLSNVAEVALTGTNGYALGADGTVRSWGLNQHGQLCVGSITSGYQSAPLLSEISP